ncbi:MAG: copper homeostasis membrane protein CopD [Bradyrhizobium sp.]|nr:copper homeostasis membrane protein CopD [Bradyrhizobium sp.]
MVDTGLVFTRFLHYSATLVLFGVALFPLYTYPRHELDGIGGRNRMFATYWALSLVSLVSGALWFASVAMSMSDTGMSWEAARFVLTQTAYGAVCLARLATLAALVCVLALLSLRPVHRLDLLFATLCAFLAASLAGTGHTQIEEGLSHLGHMLADALHLIGAGAWLGGLAVLFYLTATSLNPSSSESTRLEALTAAHRFSDMGYLAVATIVGSGLVNSWFLVSPLTSVIETEYGRLLLIKVALFTVMVGLAGVNRVFILPALTTVGATCGVNTLRRLRLHILLEQCLGLAIILVIAFLGTMEPAISASQ